MSGSIFDFAVYFFHNLQVRLSQGCGGVYFYLPKLEAYREARLWNDVFVAVSLNIFKNNKNEIRFLNDNGFLGEMKKRKSLHFKFL